MRQLRSSVHILLLSCLSAGAALGCDDASSSLEDASPSSMDAATGMDAAARADAAPRTDAARSDSGGAATTDGASGSGAGCGSPDEAWIVCEDFEGGGGDFDTWLAGSDFIRALGGEDRGRITLSDDGPRSGSWSLYMPAAPESGHRGASLDWWDCVGEQATNCDLESHDQLYLRAMIRFAEDHRYVHHFLALAGSQPDDFWYHGTAGCLPNGELSMGTTVDHREGSHETFFYTYSPDMSCDTRCDRYADVDAICAECESKGLPTCTEQPQCCWGNNYAPDPAVAFPTGRWFCFEMTMRANTPGEPDGSMAYWIDGELAHEVDGMLFRTSPTLALNRARLQHYITEGDADGFSNRVWFDDVVISTERIGCPSL